MPTCSVVTQNCTAPAGYATGLGYSTNRDLPKRLPNCYQCGDSVCGECSTRVGRSRLCLNCQSDNVRMWL